MNQKPTFLLGAHKSGTSLLRSLFDGHSQLYTIPIEAHYFQNRKYWVDNEYRLERPARLDKAQTIDNFCAYIHRSNTAEDPYSDSVTKGLFDEERFRSYFSSIQPDLGDKACIEKYFEAIHFSITGTTLPDRIRVVEKSVENAEFAQELSLLFPQARFIHIVRNPYANFVSLRKYKSVNWGAPIIRRIVRTLYNSYYYLYRNQRTIEPYYVLRYEDLVTEPEKHIRSMCRFLQIPFEKALLSPTHQGNVWHGNSVRGLVFNSISASNLEKWKPEIHPMEVEYIDHLFYFLLRDYGYEPFQKKGSFWSRLAGETPKRYVANRLFKYYLQEWEWET